MSNYSGPRQMDANQSQASVDYVNSLEERSRSEIRKRRIGEFTQKLANTYHGEQPDIHRDGYHHKELPPQTIAINDSE